MGNVPMPRFIPPMLARDAPPESVVRSRWAKADWAAEVKWDGCRAQVRIERQVVSVHSRPGNDRTDRFPEVQELAAALGPHTAILDAEVVCFGDDGLPDFSRVRARMHSRSVSRSTAPATLMLFDLLYLDGADATALPYWRRRELLDELALDGPAWQTPASFVGEEALALITATREMSLEGIVIKRLDGTYTPGARTRAWQKLKHRQTEEFVVVAWAPAREGAPMSFALCRETDRGLHNVGSVGFGLPRADRDGLRQLVEQHELPAPAKPNRRWRSVRPVVRVAVAYHGSGATLRDPVLRAVLP